MICWSAPVLQLQCYNLVSDIAHISNFIQHARYIRNRVTTITRVICKTRWHGSQVISQQTKKKESTCLVPISASVPHRWPLVVIRHNKHTVAATVRKTNAVLGQGDQCCQLHTMSAVLCCFNDFATQLRYRMYQAGRQSGSAGTRQARLRGAVAYGGLWGSRQCSNSELSVVISNCPVRTSVQVESCLPGTIQVQTSTGQVQTGGTLATVYSKFRRAPSLDLVSCCRVLSRRSWERYFATYTLHHVR